MKRLQFFIFSFSLLLLAAGSVFSHNEPNIKPYGGGSGSVEREQKEWGIAGDADAVQRTIEVRMLDTMRFVPEKITVQVGETVKFVVINDGGMLHEFVLGTKEENDEHAELMMKFPDMVHDEPHMAHVEAGAKGEIVWHFNVPGTFYYACLIAGHYQSGMVGEITVAIADASGRL